ncbi:MAG: glycosyltransferase family 2 protein [Acidobacteria bacterium]|nr:glycosyltransferase family 2 protein [Acidobacteriota bacterium]
MFTLASGGGLRTFPNRISIIIPNWNGVPFLFELFASLRSGGPHPRREIIVVDNHSSDSSADMIRTFFPETRIIRLDENLGFAAAVNRGLHASTGEYVAVVNNDVSWEHDWLAAGADFLDCHQEYEFVAPRVLNYFQRQLLDSAGDGLTWHLRPYKRGNGRPKEEFDSPGRIWAASCSAVLFRRSFFERVGAFDEDFFMYYEDVDLFFRSILKGFQGYLHTDIEVYHREGGSIDRFERSPQRKGARLLKPYLLQRNRDFLLLKNCPGFYLLLGFPWLAWELLRVTFLFTRWRRLGTFLNAHFHALKHWRIMWRKRSLIQKRRKLTIPQFYQCLG